MVKVIKKFHEIFLRDNQIRPVSNGTIWQQLSQERDILHAGSEKPGLVSGSVVWSRGVWWERTGWTIEGRQDSAAAKDGAAPLWPWPVDQSEHFLDHTFISSAGALFLKYNVDSLAVCMWMVSATLPFSQCQLEHPQCMQPVVMLKSGHIIHAS